MGHQHIQLVRPILDKLFNWMDSRRRLWISWWLRRHGNPRNTHQRHLRSSLENLPLYFCGLPRWDAIAFPHRDPPGKWFSNCYRVFHPPNRLRVSFMGRESEVKSLTHWGPLLPIAAIEPQSKWVKTGRSHYRCVICRARETALLSRTGANCFWMK